ncbi:MAG TPA: alpha/beta hydrolase [Stellaceae bacterium]|jgi:carboxypeptidase C (cathepsin A)|nr:alpha/beta hydrolase [Stellaceae bacterium]
MTLTDPLAQFRLRLAGPTSAIAGAAFCLMSIVVPAAGADEKPTRSASELPARVETHHTVDLADRPLDYRAVAETIGLTDQKGNPTASVYTVSYLADAPAGKQRPVAFVFNGGPGAASVFLHLGALGPRILDTPASGAVPNPPVRLVNNPSTWLPFTDLVFIDPVGTGFSRGKGKEDNPDKPFWSIRSDLNSLGAVVHRWLTRHERWSAPIFLVGESYGGLRAAALAGRLPRDVGVTLSGLVLVSPALDIDILHPAISNALAPAFELPSFAASAAALSGRKWTADDAEAVERFALSDYLVGLAGMKGVPASGDPFVARVAAMIGLGDDIVRRERGRVGGRTFAHELRRAQGEILSVYDATVTRATTANPWDDRGGDPVLDPAVAAYTAAFDTYAPATLGYRTENPYRVLPNEVSQQWDWDGARGGEGGLGLALSSLQKTLLAYPETRLLVANGRYDLVTPYLASRWLVDQLAVPAAVRAGIRLRVYDGGHMMYMRPQMRAALAADAAEIFAAPGAAPSR